jgi:hypothetical protein
MHLYLSEFQDSWPHNVFTLNLQLNENKANKIYKFGPKIGISLQMGPK